MHLIIDKPEGENFIFQT